MLISFKDKSGAEFAMQPEGMLGCRPVEWTPGRDDKPDDPRAGQVFTEILFARCSHTLVVQMGVTELLQAIGEAFDAMAKQPRLMQAVPAPHGLLMPGPRGAQ